MDSLYIRLGYTCLPPVKQHGCDFILSYNKAGRKMFCHFYRCMHRSALFYDISKKQILCRTTAI